MAAAQYHIAIADKIAVLISGYLNDVHGEGDTTNVDVQNRWAIRFGQAIRQYAPIGSQYLANLDFVIRGARRASWHGITELRTILEALENDYRAGYLQTVPERIHADMFADFLEMSEYLMGDGLKDPAAVLIGGVLEQHLRQLAQKNGVAVETATTTGTKPKKADALNADLATTGAYGKNEQKQITAWLGIRNSAGHANYTEYTKEQVDLFLQGLRDFIARHPA
jgi:hypothetical protein